jgi:hypothetical protein
MALVQEYFPTRRAEELRSGDQIVQLDGRWDRVHGVGGWDEDGVNVAGVVFVRTDNHYNTWPRYSVGALVKVV